MRILTWPAAGHLAAGQMRNGAVALKSKNEEVKQHHRRLSRCFVMCAAVWTWPKSRIPAFRSDLWLPERIFTISDRMRKTNIENLNQRHASTVSHFWGGWETLQTEDSCGSCFEQFCVAFMMSKSLLCRPSGNYMLQCAEKLVCVIHNNLRFKQLILRLIHFNLLQINQRNYYWLVCFSNFFRTKCKNPHTQNFSGFINLLYMISNRKVFWNLAVAHVWGHRSSFTRWFYSTQKCAPAFPEKEKKEQEVDGEEDKGRERSRTYLLSAVNCTEALMSGR